MKENWWQVDMESLITVQQIKIGFPSENNYQYKVQVSSDGVSWKDIFVQSPNSKTDKKQILDIQDAPTSRFLRIVFIAIPSDKQASLSEVEVYGKRK